MPHSGVGVGILLVFVAIWPASQLQLQRLAFSSRSTLRHDPPDNGYIGHGKPIVFAQQSYYICIKHAPIQIRIMKFPVLEFFEEDSSYIHLYDRMHNA